MQVFQRKRSLFGQRENERISPEIIRRPISTSGRPFGTKSNQEKRLRGLFEASMSSRASFLDEASNWTANISLDFANGLRQRSKMDEVDVFLEREMLKGVINYETFEKLREEYLRQKGTQVDEQVSTARKTLASFVGKPKEEQPSFEKIKGKRSSLSLNESLVRTKGKTKEFEEMRTDQKTIKGRINKVESVNETIKEQKRNLKQIFKPQSIKIGKISFKTEKKEQRKGEESVSEAEKTQEEIRQRKQTTSFEQFFSQKLYKKEEKENRANLSIETTIKEFTNQNSRKNLGRTSVISLIKEKNKLVFF